jgi:uncharacterized membrane protein YfcA
MEWHTALALVLSGTIGVSLGLLGGGGSILAVPVLVYVAGIEAKAAVAMSLAIVGATSLVASLLHRQHGRLDAKIAQFIRICRWLKLIYKERLAPLENAPFSTPWA